MTKAKRYEGEKQRGDIWHSNMRDRVWELIQGHQNELRNIFPNYTRCGKVVLFDWWFNEGNMSYDISTKVFEGNDVHGVRSYHGYAIMTHREDFMVFPSDHLKTKLLLLAG